MALLSTIDSNDHLDVKADVKTIAHTKCKPFLVGVMCWFKNGESFRVFYLFIFSLFYVFRKTLERLVIFADIHPVHMSDALEFPRVHALLHLE